MENLNLNETSVFYLQIIRKWTKIISIIMFVMIGIMLLFGIVMSLAMNTITSEELKMPLPFPIGAMAMMYVLMAVLYFFPVFYLYKFSQHLETALYGHSDEELNTALRYLKNHYNLVGILMIVGIALMILAFFVAIIAGVMGVAATSGGNFL
jgi:hypothetical protein